MGVNSGFLEALLPAEFTPRAMLAVVGFQNATHFADFTPKAMPAAVGVSTRIAPCPANASYACNSGDFKLSPLAEGVSLKVLIPINILPAI